MTADPQRRRIIVNQRQDYTNGDQIRADGVMSVTAERADGTTDTVVYAPTARAKAAR